MLSQKCVQIISYLCQQASNKEFVHIDELASKFNVSERTIRYDIDKIDYFFKENSFNELLREKGVGIRLNESHENIRRIKQTLLESNMQDYVMTKNERIVFIVMMLFDAEDFIKYDEIASKFFVSRKTAIEDVRSLKEDIGKGGLKSTKNGIMFAIDEPERRKILMNYVLSVLTPLELYEIANDIFPNISIVIERKWCEMINSSFANVCEKMLRITENNNKKVLTDDYYYLVVILTALAFSRMEQGRGMNHKGEDNEKDAFVNEFFDRAGKALAIEMNRCERSLIQTEVARILQVNNNEGLAMKADLIAEQFIVRVSELSGEKYYLDHTLRQSLRQHLERVLRSGGRTGKAAVALVKYREKNEDLFHEVSKLLHEIGAFDTIEDNADLIMLHFLAARERKQNKDNARYRVLVVCLNGIGTAKMLSAIVLKHFPEVEVIDTTSLHRVDELVDKEKPDFILTTVPLNNKNTTVVEVHPMLSASDIEKIRSLIKNHPKERMSKPLNVYDKLMKVIGETCDIRNMDALERQIKNILRLDETPKKLKLKDLLTPETIQIGVEVSDWKEAVKKSAVPLLDLSFIAESYIDAMVKNIITMGPYVVIAPGIAMPHALPEDGVNQSCISLTILKDEISFEKTPKGPVKLLFTFGSKDGKEHMNVLSELIPVINDRKLINRIVKAETKKEVLRLLHLV